MVRRMEYVEPHPRSGVYRVRRALPERLRAVVGQRSLSRSLGTKELGEARQRAPATLAAFQRQIDDAEAILRATADGEAAEVSLTFPEGARLIATWRDAYLRRLAHLLTTGTGKVGDYLAVADTTGEATALWRDRPDVMISLYYANQPVPMPIQERTLGRLLAAAGHRLPARHPLRSPLLGVLRDAITEIRRREEALGAGHWTADDIAMVATDVSPSGIAPSPAASVVSATPVAAPRRSPITLSVLVDRHIARTRSPAQTASEQRLAMRRFIGFLGADMFVHQIDFAHAEEFYEVLLWLPRAMTREEAQLPIVQLTQAMRAGGARQRISQKTADKQIALLGAMMRWAKNRGFSHIEPFAQLILPGAVPAIRRLPFREQELRAIFAAPLFTGCAGPKRWREPGSHLVADHRFWLPLLALATGMRIEEIGQLLVTDIKMDDGIPYLDITEEVISEDVLDDDPNGREPYTKSLKTVSSIRRVPLHRLAMDAGIMEYLKLLRAAGESALFPQLPREGKKTKNSSRGFNRDFLTAVGITNPAMRFHSFRHLFKDRCRAAKLPVEVHDALTGHTNASVGAGYGLGVPVQVLKEAVDRLTFPGYVPVPRRTAAHFET